LAALSYGSTNIDNLAVLSAYSVKPGYRASLVRLTFLAVCLAVLVVSFLLAQAADHSFLGQRLHYLGLIPLALGGWQLLQLARGRASEPQPDKSSGAASTGLAAYFSFALVLLANSGDSVGVMTPLLADLKPSLVLTSFAAALIVAVVMTGLARFLAHHPATRDHVQRLAKWALPFLLMAIGVLILTARPAEVFASKGCRVVEMARAQNL
jgi:cadmium resistance protein CadD (predicted permease)